MKITLQKTETEGEEIIIRYHEMSQKIVDLVRRLTDSGDRLAGTKGDGQELYFFAPEDVFYFEAVDGFVYAYLEKDVYRVKDKLEGIIYQYESRGIVRCARTMAVNLYKVEWLKSQPGGRILAALLNGEKIVISRKYAGMLRERLKTGMGNR